MRWNCPHCSVALSIPDEKIGNAWSFSRCYQCSGFSLVRRGEDKSEQAIRVNKEPALGRFINAQDPDRPVVKPAPRRGTGNTKTVTLTPSQGLARPHLSVEARLPDPLPDTPVRESRVAVIVPAAIAIAGVLAVSSGIYLYAQGRALWQKTRIGAAPAAQLRVAAADVPRPEPQNLAVAPGPAPIVDRVNQRAMAPTRGNPPSRAAPGAATLDLPNTALVVRTRIKNATLRAGPGLEYPIVGQADAELRYFVADWRDRWFKISLPSAAPSGERVAWIRNDLVQLLTNGNAPVEAPAQP
jgi:hypothetical protein